MLASSKFQGEQASSLFFHLLLTSTFAFTVKFLFYIPNFSTLHLIMVAVHGPSIAAHPTGFQAHNMPGPWMGFHPALAQPTVSAHNFSYVDFQLTFIKAPQQPKQLAAAQAGSKLIPTTATRTRPACMLDLSRICLCVLSTLPLPPARIQSSPTS